MTHSEPTQALSPAAQAAHDARLAADKAESAAFAAAVLELRAQERAEARMTLTPAAQAAKDLIMSGGGYIDPNTAEAVADAVCAADRKASA